MDWLVTWQKLNPEYETVKGQQLFPECDLKDVLEELKELNDQAITEIKIVNYSH